MPAKDDDDDNDAHSANSLQHVYEHDLVSALQSVKLPPNLVDEQAAVGLLDETTRGLRSQQRTAPPSEAAAAEQPGEPQQHPRKHGTKKRHPQTNHVHHESPAGPATSIFPKGYDWRGGSDLLTVVSYASSVSTTSSSKKQKKWTSAMSNHTHTTTDDSVEGHPSGGFQHYGDNLPSLRGAHRHQYEDDRARSHNRWDAEASPVPPGVSTLAFHDAPSRHHHGHQEHYDSYNEANDYEERLRHHDHDARHHHHHDRPYEHQSSSFGDREDMERGHHQHHDMSSDDGYVSPSSAAYHRRRFHRRRQRSPHHQREHEDRPLHQHHDNGHFAPDNHYRPPTISHHYVQSSMSSHPHSLSQHEERHHHHPTTTPQDIPRKTVEISPGVVVPLRGAAETRECVKRDFFIPTQCVSCQLEDLFVVQDAAYVLCPVCRVVNPLTTPTADHEYGGLGLGFTMDELASIHQELLLGNNNNE